MRFGKQEETILSSVTTTRRPHGVIETVFRGCVDGTLAAKAETELFQLINKDGIRLWYVDASGVTFNATVREPASHLVSRYLKISEGKMVVLITSSPVRMMAIAIAFATGAHMNIVETPEKAKAKIHALLGLP